MQEVSRKAFAETWYHDATNTIKSFWECWSGLHRTLWVQNCQRGIWKSMPGFVYLCSIAGSLPWFGKEHGGWYLQAMPERVHCKKRKSKINDKQQCKNFQSNSEVAERPSTECRYQRNACQTTGRMDIQFIKNPMLGRILWENDWIDKECTTKVIWMIQTTLWNTERSSSRSWSYT